MKLRFCAVCGVEKDKEMHGKPVELEQVMIIPVSKVELFDVNDGTITLCQRCKGAMPFDTNKLFSPDAAKLDVSDHHQELFLRFAKIYISEIYNGTRVPSFTELAHAYNKAGLRTMNGREWTYHNFMQYAYKCGLDREGIMAEAQGIMLPKTDEELRQMARRGNVNSAPTTENDIAMQETLKLILGGNDDNDVKEMKRAKETKADNFDDILTSISEMPKGLPGL